MNIEHYCQGCGAAFLDKKKRGLCIHCKRRIPKQRFFHVVMDTLMRSVVWVLGLVAVAMIMALIQGGIATLVGGGG